MARHTRKYLSAVEVAGRLGLTALDEAESLYQELNHKNFFWDASEGRWLPGSDPDPATNLIRLRVWAETQKVEEVANTVVRKLSAAGFSLVEKSQPYMCRPPNQLESRVYLTFREDDDRRG